MQVIATAGHVDHGKSALVRALTGMEPDRWAEERRRGMTIDLGFAWSALPSGATVAFVDVPGHERFMTNMLAGIGPVPAVMVVVAADDGWSAQTTEHVAAIDALRVEHGLLVITRSDLADPAPAMAEAQARLATTSLGAVDGVAACALDGTGLPELREALDRLVARVHPPPPAARVRLWIDRAFTVTGFGTVVTGTLGAGSIRVGDLLDLEGEAIAVRGLECMGSQHDAVRAVARVAVNLRGQPRRRVSRGQALLTPGAWHRTDRLDVRLTGPRPERLPAELTLHLGSAAVPARVRPLGPDHARLTLRSRLPVQVGDRMLLRDPGRRHVVTGLVVIDPAPPGLAERGAARRRSAVLDEASESPSVGSEVRRRKVVRRTLLTQLGVGTGDLPIGAVEHAGWVVDLDQWETWRQRLGQLVDSAANSSDRLLHAGVAAPAAGQALGLPDPALIGALVTASPQLQLADGHISAKGSSRSVVDPLLRSLQPLLDRLAAAPFEAPTANDLADAGLGPPQLGAAAAAGLILRLPGDVVLLPDATDRAAERLADLTQPFTLSAARQALGTTRRVAVPLMELLDRLGVTRRDDNARRRLV